MSVEREKFPDRRPGVTQRVTHVLSTGGEIHMLVTFGYYGAGDHRVREVFCADFKAGSDQHTLVIDASIVVSRLLQTGVTPRALLSSLSEPRSIIGSILEAAAELEESLNAEEKKP